ncbi:MAG: hypothetical protein Ct9H300mP7_0050 [Verrucomicrobiota bacterium]|nr:MAG: hypothetical protein Ct9H300mP7_0050 [Verrucomicrobiota bacterium]
MFQLALNRQPKPVELANAKVFIEDLAAWKKLEPNPAGSMACFGPRPCLTLRSLSICNEQTTNPFSA